MVKPSATIYLAGPITHVTTLDAAHWRFIAKQYFDSKNYEVIDPTTYNSIEKDKENILKSTVVLANFDYRTEGTPMEIFYAFEHRIPVISFTTTSTVISDWVPKHSTLYLNERTLHEVLKQTSTFISREKHKG